MENKEKKNHHFVPQIYLSKFAHSTELKGKKKHYFVSTYDKNENIENSKNDVKNICFKSKLYTIDSSKREKRESIENFYAETIENDYNRFYNIITNDKKIKISIEERGLIITTIINLHLRNFFWVKAINDFWTDLIKGYDISNSVSIYGENGEVFFPLEEQRVEKVISTHKEGNKQIFIKEHLQKTLNLSKSHCNDIIFVDKVTNDIGFVTSDRPVICTNISGSFSLPIDRNYILTVMPNKEKADYNPENIIRNNPFIDSKIFNLMQYENAMRHIIGFNLNEIKQAKSDYEKANIANSGFPQ